MKCLVYFENPAFHITAKKSENSYKTKKFFFRNYGKNNWSMLSNNCVYEWRFLYNNFVLVVLSVKILLLKNAFTYSKMARPKVMKNILSV